MDRVRTVLTYAYPNPHEHSRHAIIAVAVSLFIFAPETMYTLIQKLDNNMMKWSLIYACLLGFFYFFSSPFMGRTIKPNYSNFSRWYITWILVAALYHLPSLESMGVDTRMNLTMFIFAIFVLIGFHLVFHGLWYTGLVSRETGTGSGILTVLRHCASSDEISLVYSLWAMYIVLYITNFAVERSSGTSADLIKTLFDLLVSVTIFLGRFDMRMMQAAMSSSHEGAKPEDFLYDHFSERGDFWFDFMADTGDGGNSSYSVARLLAQPSLQAKNYDHSLPRGDLLLIGGDLAYPNPSDYTYKKRFIRPFKYALPWPSWYKKESITVNKPELPMGVSDLKQYDGPQCFVIPGNHDWLDGLQTFMRYICQKSWLGGWLMPQKKSYFALQLPKGWWVFGLDVALHNDIDGHQFNFFSEIIHEKVKKNDSVIIMTHAPNWILDSYWNDETGKNVSHLICDHLKGRCKLRIAGDLHHYMRHSYVKSGKPAMVQHLLVNGCGGAFLHPTHVFGKHIEAYNSTYKTIKAYPSFQDSSRVCNNIKLSTMYSLCRIGGIMGGFCVGGIALDNILKFRKENWQFDFIGGSIYFILTFSMFPLVCTFEISLMFFQKKKI
ncbi:putative calcineurin-like phosphoesterase domain, ApaH type, metallo-dependent phosphatase [Helianthus anomalus]